MAPLLHRAAIIKAVSKNRCADKSPGARCKSKTGRHNQDRSRRATNNRRILTRPILIVATGLDLQRAPVLYVYLLFFCSLDRCDILRNHRHHQRYKSFVRRFKIPPSRPVRNAGVPLLSPE